MATTDLKSILDRFQAVLEASPLSLIPAQQPFSHVRQPNAVVQNSYCLEDGGQVSRRSMTNKLEARIDRIRVFIAKPLAFAPIAQFEAMTQIGDTIYRYLIADGLTQGWNVVQEGHRVSQPANQELLIGSFDYTIDYDFSASI